MSIKRIFTILFFALSVVAFSQTDPVADFNFDDCMSADQAGTFNDGVISSGVNCDCGPGINSNALYFNGTMDSVVLDPAIKSLFDDDFSVAFNIWLDDASDTYPILSIQGECATSRDSAFFIRYFPDNQELVLELTKNFGEVVELRADMDNGFCWNHILFTRQGNNYSLYLNGSFVDGFTFLSEVVLGVDYPVLIGYSPCVGVTDNSFSGRIDDLQFFNFALLGDQAISSILIDEDRILTPDTTIFEGSAFMLRTGSTCANNISWSPPTGLSSVSVQNPMASPINTVTYEVEFNHGTCISRDNVTVSVLSEDNIDCEQLLLPSAFTPNNDNLNDRYGISNAFIVEDLNRFEIFNRWGLKLFESSNKDDTWDGTFKGEKLPFGTYVYKIEYTCMSEIYRKTGSFNILK